MTRCASTDARRRRLLSVASAALLGSWLAAGQAWGQRPEDHRIFPSMALRGDLVVTSAADVQLNGRTERLAPGARIRGENNELLLSSSLVGQRMTVHYTLERPTGLLMDIWVLRPVERANRPWPSQPQESQTWVFDPAAQTWKKP
jgi:hypothetical protein